ncbi:hypothetical protein [Fusibacter sp. 3D3]|uniref:hypothetical protein n=1 Tax=Fusibacter sp. 3D3 TaxID=1048380 RepID=UPI000853328C|nr:hypothetical protein [Fusibacter sp. 3D3]GAU78459.1 hypothetical protein F3D3_3093 [Fusibacter sp. 3D3]
MRISTQMQNESMLQMQSSEYYKKATQTENDTKTNKDNNEISLGNDLVVKKDKDTLILSKLGKDKSKEVLQEIPLNSKAGAALSEYINSSDTATAKTEYEKALDEINNANRTMSLANYL